MRGTGIGTSLLLIATGAILAFAVNYQTTGIDINAVGWILMLVGIIGLMLSFLVFGGLTTLYDDAIHGRQTETHVYDDITPPHEHRRVETKDVVYESDDGSRVERERRISP